jgi:hypothetical protein
MIATAIFTLFFPGFGYSGELAHNQQSEEEGGVVSGELSGERRCGEEANGSREGGSRGCMGFYSLGVISV